jgi:predicted TIM-barrel fold metal-dependent hydrolase
MVPKSAERKTRLIDCHVHLPWERCIPRAFLDGTIANMMANLQARHITASHSTLADRALERLQDRDGDRLVAEMDSAGIEQAAVLVPDFTYALREPNHTIEDLLKHHHRVALRHPGRLVMFAGVDPRWGRDGLALFERAVVEWGFRGLKLYPPCGYDPSDEMLFPYYEICQQRGLPVLMHTGPTSPALAFEPAHPMRLDRASLRFAKVNFILGHGGSVYVDESLLLAAYRPNVFVEISGFQSLGGLPRAMEHLRALFAKGLSHKILFGTDYPVFQLRMADITRALLEEGGPLEDLSDLDAALITHENFLRLYDRTNT